MGKKCSLSEFCTRFHSKKSNKISEIFEKSYNCLFLMKFEQFLQSIPV